MSLFLKGQLISTGGGDMSRIMMIIAAFVLKQISVMKEAFSISSDSLLQLILLAFFKLAKLKHEHSVLLHEMKWAEEGNA